MPFNITIDHATTDRGDHSSRSSGSLSEGEDSAGTGVHLSSPRSPRSAIESHEYEDQDGSWNVLFPDEIGPSDSASRPRTSNQQRPIVEAPRPEEARRPSYRRHITHEPIANIPAARTHRLPPSTQPESVDSQEDWQGYAHGPPHHYGRLYSPPAPIYSPSHYSTYSQQNVMPSGHQQVVPYGISPYVSAPGGPAHSYFPQNQHGGPGMSPLIASSATSSYGPPAAYYAYQPPGYHMPQSMHLPGMYQPYPHMYSSAAAPQPGNTSLSSPDTSKDDEKFARLEKLLMDQKEEQAAKEAAAEKAAKDKATEVEAEVKKAAEIKAASEAAASAAKEEVEKKHKEEAEKKQKADKEEAEKKQKAEKVAAEKAAAAKPPPKPKEKDKPIKFKDAVGRKFSFPFHLCSTWSGMEYLIKEAFVHVEGIGPHVADGHYDLLGPQGEIILPHVWDTVIEPDWTITMHMWPMAEEGKDDAIAAKLDDLLLTEEGKKGKRKGQSGLPPFMAWTAGKKQKKPVKAKKT